MKHKQQLAHLTEWRNSSSETLHAKLAELHKDLQSFRVQKATGQLGQHHLLAAARRDIARIKTVMREQQLAAKAGTSATDSSATSLQEKR